MTAIDQALARMDEHEQTVTARDTAARRKAEAEFADIDLDALVRLFTPSQPVLPQWRRQRVAL